MKTFKLDEHTEVVCEYEKTRHGFRHIAVLLIDGREVERDKCCYYNRTWEGYEFQSVLIKVVNKATKNKIITEQKRASYIEWLDKDHTDWSGFEATRMVAMLGDVMCQTQKESNDWKARILKAGLGNMGLEMPEDWDSLDENTKQARLDLVIKMLDKPKQ